MTSPPVTGSTEVRDLVLVTVSIVVASSPASRMTLKSTVARGSPALTRCFLLTFDSKPRPSRPTVSMPMWTRTSTPSSVLMP